MTRRALAACAVAALAAAGCGYAVRPRGGALAGGAASVFVRPLEDRTTDAEAGALVGAALRRELARRGAEGGPAAPARLEGAVESVTAGAATPNGAVYRLALVVSTRLVVGDRVVVEQRTSREEDWLAGQDPLESEGRRRLALRHAADAAAREIVERLEGL